MSFLDNLENNLKNLEQRETKDSDTLRRERDQAKADKAAAQAAAPYAEELRKGAFTQELLTQSVAIGHSLRTKVQMAWVGSVLRLDARERRLELRPTAEGVRAHFFRDGSETGSEIVSLEQTGASRLAERWLKE